MLHIRIALLLCLAGLLPLWSVARADPADHWYKVELIAFERLDGPSAGGEVWPTDPEQPDWHNAVALQPNTSGEPIPFERLARKDDELGPHLWSLSRARSGVRPLIHRAWVQPIGPARAASAVYLRSSGSVDTDEAAGAGRDIGATARMEGTITLSRSRFLHAHVDLLLRRPGASKENGAAGMQTYRLQADRRMRVGELHYIDHPAMGLLIKVTRLGPAVDDEPSDAGAAPAGGT